MKDKGCELADKFLRRSSRCETCPFYPQYTDCILGQGQGQRLHKEIRRRRAREMYPDYSVEEIADALKVTEKTALKYLGVARG